MASFSAGGPQGLFMSDLTLQGGRWGIYLTSIVGTAGTTLAQQYFDQQFSHVCLRDMAQGGVFLDGIYAWDNCSTAYVDFVNCPIGFQSIGRPGIDSTPDINYMDQCLFYGCQWRDCAQGFRLSAGRQCNSNYFVDCIFENNTESAIRSQIVADPLNWQDSVNPGNRGPYLGRHIHYYNCTVGVPLGQWLNGVAIESDFQHPSDAALRARVIWTETTVSGAFEPWPVVADHIARHVLVAGTPMPRPQLLITR